MPTATSDTIAAIATPSGRGGVGILRISGNQLQDLIPALVGKTLQPRVASYGPFLGAAGEVIDEGIALYFPAPASFTGEDVIELQGHGGVVVLGMLLRRVLALGVRQARPGEFSERAFINGKMDLTQVEAVADLVNASSETAAQSAVRSLQGAFSAHIHVLVEALIHLRMYVESAIDFPEEEIDFLADGKVGERVSALLAQVETVLGCAQQGALLREGTTVAIVGRPNAGKSSLMNALAQRDTAIVTEVAGTTRDVLREAILLDDLPLYLVDTAGLRDTDDVVEREGVRRAWGEIETADQVLYVIDSTLLNNGGDISAKELETQLTQEWRELVERLPVRHVSRQHPSLQSDSVKTRVAIVLNKIDRSDLDLSSITPVITAITGGETGVPVIALSAKTGAGMDTLKAHLQVSAGFQHGSEGVFSARERHLVAMQAAQKHLRLAEGLMSSTAAGELVAEELRCAQEQLGSITGEFTSDDLLGEIFSSFCVGK